MERSLRATEAGILDRYSVARGPPTGRRLHGPHAHAHDGYHEDTYSADERCGYHGSWTKHRQPPVVIWALRLLDTR